MHKVTLIPGDGIGPEVTRCAVKVIEASGAKIDFEVVEAGEKVMEKEGTPLPEQVLESIRRNKVALKGPITTPVGSGFRSVNVALRQALDLFACLRPAKSFEGIPSRYKNVDLVVVRENTEDLYAGIEFFRDTDEVRAVISCLEAQSRKKIRSDSAISVKPISETASNRIIKFACDYALKNNRRRVTAVHKANIMKATDGLFLECSRKIGAKYAEKGLTVDDCIVDAASMQLVKNPENFDVLVLPNLYGDIISDLCAGLIGGLGVAPGANIGDDYAVFEPVHGSAPKYTGMDKVNPTATIQSGVLMLKHLGEDKAAKKIEEALAEAFKEGKQLTYDLGGKAKMSEFTDYVISKIK